MKQIKFILYILCILISNMYLQAQETKTLKIDSIKLDEFTYKGISLFPEDTAEVNRTGVYLCLKMNDSLIIVSDNSQLFNYKINQLKDKKSIVKAFSNYYKICFSDYLPISVAIYNNLDTILYSKTPPRTNKYKLESAVINDTIFHLGNIHVGLSRDKLCKELGIDNQNIKDINHIFILGRPYDKYIHEMWYTKYNIPRKDMNSEFGSILITLNQGIISSILISSYCGDLIIEPRFRSRYGEVEFCD